MQGSPDTAQTCLVVVQQEARWTIHMSINRTDIDGARTQRARYSSEGGQTTTTMNVWMVQQGWAPSGLLWWTEQPQQRASCRSRLYEMQTQGQNQLMGPEVRVRSLQRRKSEQYWGAHTKEVQGAGKHSISSGCWLCRQVHFVLPSNVRLQVMHFYL